MKKALLIGLNYQETNSPLYGCWNDVENMRNTLQKIGYTNITIMTDEVKNQRTSLYPNRTNFLRQFENFIVQSKPKDTLFFYFSGHGGQTRDLNRDEKDGKDETLFVRSDNHIRSLSPIIDDILRSIINRMSNFTKLRCILDCCHSGTAMDLPYRWIINRSYFQESLASIKNVLMISGCEDKDYSSEIVIDDKPRGALSTFLLPLIEQENKKARWLDLIYKIQDDLKNNGYSQIPQCSFTSIQILTSPIDL